MDMALIRLMSALCEPSVRRVHAMAWEESALSHRGRAVGSHGGVRVVGSHGGVRVVGSHGGGRLERWGMVTECDELLAYGGEGAGAEYERAVAGGGMEGTPAATCQPRFKHTCLSRRTDLRCGTGGA
jgi:hypothetical protein